MKDRYNHLNSYLKNKFNKRVLKICIDGGFSCPNRDGTKGYGGCIFCGEDGAGENIKGKCSGIFQSIENQVNTFLSSYRGDRAEKFIVYFQSFSNTYDTVENLKKRYDVALKCSDKIIGLEIATRPDLISEEVARLIASYKDKYYVCVELGLQTANDMIGEKLNRGYTVADFEKACVILKSYNIDIVGHMMVGLPNETENDIFNTIDVINKYCNGVKLHSTYVQRNTILEKMYLSGEYKPISMEYYVDIVAKIISRLKSDIIIHRINADPPKDKLVAPNWQLRKKIVINAINKELDNKDIYQGCN